MRKESNDFALGVCTVPNESHGYTDLDSGAISSITNHHLFYLQNCRWILSRVMRECLVKVLFLTRVICGTRVTLLSFGTRECIDFFKSGICHNLNGDFNEAKGVNKNVKIVI